MRLHCMLATVLFGSGTLVPPEDGDLASLLRELRSDLDVAVALFRTCAGLIEPLERLQAQISPE